MKVKDLTLGHLNSRKLGEALEELKTLNFEDDANAYYQSYKSENNSSYQPQFNPRILTLQQTANALRLLQGILGKPTSYEKPGFYHDVVKTGRDKYGEDNRVPTMARSLDWNPKSLAKNIAASNLLAANKIPFYTTSRNGIRVYCPVECRISIMYETENVAEWISYNNKKSEQLAKRRKIRVVEKRLDKE